MGATRSSSEAIAAADVRRYRPLIVVIIIGHIISELATGAVLIWGKTDYTVNLGGTVMPITQILWGSMALDGVVIILLIWFHNAAERSFYNLLYFSPLEFRTLTALSLLALCLRHAQELERRARGY